MLTREQGRWYAESEAERDVVQIVSIRYLRALAH